MSYTSSKPFYAFIDASNLFYGGVKSLGWKVDYKKLLSYIKKEYGIKKAYYYAGVELHGFKYSVLDEKPIDLNDLLLFLNSKKKQKNLRKNYYLYLISDMKRVKFYIKLKEFGYKMELKPVKTYKEIDGTITKKANCDVDMTFDLMRYYSEYKGALVLTGDGDFVTVLKYLRKKGKVVKILARGERTAREIRQLAGGDFRDFARLRTKLEFSQK